MQRIVFEMEIRPDDETGKVKKYEVTYPYSEENLKIAQRYAYNGKVTVEDDGQPEPEPELTQLDRVEAQVTYTAMMTDTLLEV